MLVLKSMLSFENYGYYPEPIILCRIRSNEDFRQSGKRIQSTHSNYTFRTFTAIRAPGPKWVLIQTCFEEYILIILEKQWAKVWSYYFFLSENLF